MIQELSKAFRALVASLSVRPLPTIAAISILCMGYIGLRSYSALEALIVTPDEEALRFKAQLASATLVNESIEHLKQELNADNVIIRQFHNGRHDLTGIPFTETTATYYTDTYEADGEEAVSSMNKSLRMVWQQIDRPECVVLDRPVDASTMKYFKAHKETTKLVVCPLTNLLNYPVGTVTVGLSAKSTLPNKVIVDKTSTIAKRATGYLINGY